MKALDRIWPTLSILGGMVWPATASPSIPECAPQLVAFTRAAAEKRLLDLRRQQLLSVHGDLSSALDTAARLGVGFDHALHARRSFTPNPIFGPGLVDFYRAGELYYFLGQKDGTLKLPAAAERLSELYRNTVEDLAGKTVVIQGETAVRREANALTASVLQAPVDRRGTELEIGPTSATDYPTARVKYVMQAPELSHPSREFAAATADLRQAQTHAHWKDKVRPWADGPLLERLIRGAGFKSDRQYLPERNFYNWKLVAVIPPGESGNFHLAHSERRIYWSTNAEGIADGEVRVSENIEGRGRRPHSIEIFYRRDRRLIFNDGRGGRVYEPADEFWVPILLVWDEARSVYVSSNEIRDLSSHAPVSPPTRRDHDIAVECARCHSFGENFETLGPVANVPKDNSRFFLDPGGLKIIHREASRLSYIAR